MTDAALARALGGVLDRADHLNPAQLAGALGISAGDRPTMLRILDAIDVLSPQQRKRVRLTKRPLTKKQVARQAQQAAKQSLL